MEFVFWYAVIGIVVCALMTLRVFIKYGHLPLQFQPSGILVSMMLWPVVLVVLVARLFNPDR
jgi:hypothetical protein